METDYKKLFYAGIEYGGFPSKGKKLKKKGLPVKRLKRELPYLLGEGRIVVKKLQVYYALLPEYSGKTLVAGKPKGWKSHVAGQLLEEAKIRAERSFDCREQLMGQGLNGNILQVPRELMAVRLYCERPFDRICISLPDEGGEQETEQLRELLCPYLPRIRQVAFRGNVSGLSDWLEEYLYNEFGIVMTKFCGAIGDMPWLDLQEDGDEGKEQQPSEKGKGEGRHITPALALKFLDTAVKNGYNTDVNS